MKTCRTCKKRKKETSFSRTIKRKDGLQVDCKACCAVYAASYRAANLEKLREQNRQYVAANGEYMRAKTRAWTAANRERKRAADAAYAVKHAEALAVLGVIRRLENKEKIKAGKTRYRQENKAAIRDRRRAKYAENPSSRQASNAARKAQKIKACPPWANREAMALFYNFAALCTRESGEPCQVDHIVPLRSPLVCGLHCENNLQVLTSAENLLKGNTFEVSDER